MTSLQDRVKGHKTERLNPLENIIAVSDDGLLGIKHIKIVAKAIVEAHFTKGDLKNDVIYLSNLIILSDNELLDIEHVKKIAKAIVGAYEMIEWEKLKKQ